MGQDVPIQFPVSGPLDTSRPSTNQPPGVLVKAINTATKALGPRRGMKQMSWVGRTPTSGISVYIPGACPDFSFDGTNTYVKGITALEQKDLSNRWTMDVAWHAYAARSVVTPVPVFQWRIDSSITAINIGVYGSGHANANKVYATVKTTSSAGTVASTYTLVGGTVLYGDKDTYLSNGSIIRCFVRLIRDGANLYLLDSTGATASSSSLSASQPHTGNASQAGSWLFADDGNLGANATFQGLVLRAVLRDSVAPTTVPPPAIEHIFPHSRSVRFFSSTKLLTSTHVADQSSYRAHGLVSSAGATVNVGDRHHPFAKTVQGIGSFVDTNGQALSAVMCGGLLFYQRVR